MEEGLAQLFYDKLQDKDQNPGVVLEQLYCTFYEKEFDPKLIPFFAKLVRIYGRNIAYLALLDLFDVEEVTHDHIAGFITYLAKKRLENKFTVSEVVDLSSTLTEYEKELKRIKKQKLEGVKDPFDDGHTTV